MASISTLRRDIQPFARALFDIAREAGLNPRITSARRSRREQARLYRLFLAGKTRFPAAPPGKSLHETGTAFDMVVSPASALAELGAIWESWGGRWGGRFKDPIHFDLG